MNSFEKLGAFYLGRPYDPAERAASPAPLLYDSKDLTTHGLIVGMTGSGKTGLAIVLLEEAALDGIPSIVIDPKGDMANLALRFPALAPEDFLPWIESARSGRAGRDSRRAGARDLPELGGGNRRLGAVEETGSARSRRLAPSRSIRLEARPDDLSRCFGAFPRRPRASSRTGTPSARES